MGYQSSRTAPRRAGQGRGISGCPPTRTPSQPECESTATPWPCVLSKPCCSVPSSTPDRGWRRRCELTQVGQAEGRFDGADLFHRIIEAVFAEHLMLDVLELIGQFVELLVGEVRLPGREYDRVFASSVVAVHQDKCLQRACQRLGVGSRDASVLGYRQQIASDLAPPGVLREKNVHELGRFSGALPHHREDVLFFQHLLMVVLTEIAKQN